MSARTGRSAFPRGPALFVPVEELAETRCQLRKEGSGMQRLFKTINEASRKARKAKE